MDRAKLRMIQGKMAEALALVEADCGVRFRVGNASYTDTFAKISVEAAEVDADGKVQGEKARNWVELAPLFGLPADGLGKRFVSRNGEEYEITGILAGASRFPVAAKRVKDGKGFKFEVPAVKLALAR